MPPSWQDLHQGSLQFTACQLIGIYGVLTKSSLGNILAMPPPRGRCHLDRILFASTCWGTAALEKLQQLFFFYFLMLKKNNHLKQRSAPLLLLMAVFFIIIFLMCVIFWSPIWTSHQGAHSLFHSNKACYLKCTWHSSCTFIFICNDFLGTSNIGTLSKHRTTIRTF